MNAALKPRGGHSLTAFSLGPGLTEVTVFGGTPEPPTGSNKAQPKLADTTLLQFSEWLIVCCYIPLQYVCTSVDIVYRVHVHVFAMYHYMYVCMCISTCILSLLRTTKVIRRESLGMRLRHIYVYIHMLQYMCSLQMWSSYMSICTCTCISSYMAIGIFCDELCVAMAYMILTLGCWHFMAFHANSPLYVLMLFSYLRTYRGFWSVWVGAALCSQQLQTRITRENSWETTMCSWV